MTLERHGTRGTSHRRLFCYIFRVISLQDVYSSLLFLPSFFPATAHGRKVFFFSSGAVAWHSREGTTMSPWIMRWICREHEEKNAAGTACYGIWLEAFTGSNICVQNFRRYRVSVFSVTMIFNMYFSGIWFSSSLGKLSLFALSHTPLAAHTHTEYDQTQCRPSLRVVRRQRFRQLKLDLCKHWVSICCADGKKFQRPAVGALIFRSLLFFRELKHPKNTVESICCLWFF